MVAEETALQVFVPLADDAYADDAAVADDRDTVDAEQRALARLELVAEDARDFAAHAKAPNTLKAYQAQSQRACHEVQTGTWGGCWSPSTV